MPLPPPFRHLQPLCMSLLPRTTFEINHPGHISLRFLMEMEVSGMSLVLYCKWIYSELPQPQPLFHPWFTVAPVSCFVLVTYFSIPAPFLPYHHTLCFPLALLPAFLIFSSWITSPTVTRSSSLCQSWPPLSLSWAVSRCPSCKVLTFFYPLTFLLFPHPPWLGLCLIQF